MSRILIRAGHLQEDRELLVDTLARYLTPAADAARYDWLYRDSPHGHARVWIATDSDTGQAVGAAAAFPRCFYVEQRLQTAWVLGDFCLAPHYRSLGPALQLQRACLAEVSSEDGGFWYDFPNSRMLAVYKRLEIEPAGNMIRFAKLLRVDRKVRTAVGDGFVARQLSRLGNLVLRLRDPDNAASTDVTLTQEGSCGQEFTDLARTLAGRYPLVLERSADYLNWRYFRNPFQKFELLAARSGGELRGYIFLCCTPDGMSLADLFGVEASILSGLLRGALRMARELGLDTLSVPLFESHPEAGILKQLGFRPREASPVFIQFCSPSGANHPALASNCFLMMGDRDS